MFDTTAECFTQKPFGVSLDIRHQFIKAKQRPTLSRGGAGGTWGQTAASNRTVTSSLSVWHHGGRGFRWSQREVGSEEGGLWAPEEMTNVWTTNTMSKLSCRSWFSSRTCSSGLGLVCVFVSVVIDRWVRPEFQEMAGPESGLWEELPVSEEGRSRGRESYP